MGDLKLRVERVNSTSYVAGFKTMDLNVRIDVFLNLSLDTGPIVVSGNLSNATLEGAVCFNRSNF
jgi:hypothetical protein